MYALRKDGFPRIIVTLPPRYKSAIQRNPLSLRVDLQICSEHYYSYLNDLLMNKRGPYAMGCSLSHLIFLLLLDINITPNQPPPPPFQSPQPQPLRAQNQISRLSFLFLCSVYTNWVSVQIEMVK